MYYVYIFKIKYNIQVNIINSFCKLYNFAYFKEKYFNYDNNNNFEYFKKIYVYIHYSDQCIINDIIDNYKGDTFEFNVTIIPPLNAFTKKKFVRFHLPSV